MDKTNQTITPIRNDGVLEVELPDSIIVYDTATNRGHCLNPIAASVWRACDGRNTISDLGRTVEKKYSIQGAEDVVLSILDQLRKKHLLKELSLPELSSLVSRREMVRKYIPAALVLPFIMSATAPTRAQLTSHTTPSQRPTPLSGCVPKPFTGMEIKGGNLPLFIFSGSAVSFLLVGLARRKRRRKQASVETLSEERRDIQWLIEGEHDANMPITYGVVPDSMNAVIVAEPLVEGELYFVQSKIDSDPSFVERYFRIENGQVVYIK